MCQGYENDIIWRQIQEYLPKNNRINDNNAPKEEWLEIGEEVLRHHNVYDRNCLMTYGYISESIRKYHFIELL